MKPNKAPALGGWYDVGNPIEVGSPVVFDAIHAALQRRALWITTPTHGAVGARARDVVGAVHDVDFVDDRVRIRVQWFKNGQGLVEAGGRLVWYGSRLEGRLYVEGVTIYIGLTD